MATVELGYKPNTGTLILSEGADWVCTFKETGVTWPEGTLCRLEFPTLTGVGPFLAVVSESTATASFLLQETVTTALLIPNKTPFGIYLVKTEDFLWFRGKVDRDDIA